ncbi:MAG: ferredoxin--NADP reductase [Acidobacteriota bacterium]
MRKGETVVDPTARQDADEPRRQEDAYNTRVVEVHRIHASLQIIRVRPDVPFPPFSAGQYTMLGVGEWEPGPAPATRPADRDGLLRGPYSISSPILDQTGEALLDPADETALEFYIANDRGALASRLFSLRPGRRLWLAAGATGQFTLDGIDREDDLLFLATGTGEAPHNRMIWDLLRRGHGGHIASVVCCRHRVDLGYRRVHETLARLCPRYTYIPWTTREGPWPRRHVQELLLDGTLARQAGFALDPATTCVFLCGNPAFIGRPIQAGSRRVYPEPPGIIEILETRFDFPAAGDDPAHDRIRFERY